MYQAPDYIKISAKATDLFAGYVGCPMDEFGEWQYTAPCEGTPEYAFVGDTYIGLGWGASCYSTKDAPGV